MSQGKTNSEALTLKGDRTEDRRKDGESTMKSLVELVKDICLGLVQISGLLLGLNFAFINNFGVEDRIRIRLPMILSISALATSILVGFVLLGLLPDVLDGKHKSLAHALSVLQGITFAIAIVTTTTAIFVLLCV